MNWDIFLIHIVEKMRDGWTSGYNGKWMNEKDKIYIWTIDEC
jgi:hypothetical protein